MKTKRKRMERMALILAMIISLQALLPAYALALTSGPSQPEFQGFQQAGTSDMVDLFTGNFSYNIPLMDVGGYPLNISYSSDPRMDDEASWVGLGWTLSPGAINRTMRGLPDDFKGEKIEREMNLSPDLTVGITQGLTNELAGLPIGLNLGFGMTYNNKRGFEFKTSIKPSIAISNSNQTFNAGIGFSFGASSGLDISPSVGFGSQLSSIVNSQFSLSGGMNSRAGLKALTFQGNVSATKEGEKTYSGGLGSSSSFNFGPFSYTPTASLPLINTSFLFHGTIGGEIVANHPGIQIDGFVSTQKLKFKKGKRASYGYFHLQDALKDDEALLDYNSEINGRVSPNVPYVPLSYGTYDLFSISGQGIGGQFRAMRNDLGIFRPARENNSNVSGSLGLEFGPGAFAHFGVDVSATNSQTHKNVWDKNDNEMDAHMKFTSEDKIHEPFFLKISGEQIGSSDGLLNETGGTDPVRVAQGILGNQIVAKNRFEEQSTNGATIRSMNPAPYQTIQNEERVKRNQLVTFLTAAEAKDVGLNKKILNYEKDSIVFGVCSTMAVDSMDRGIHPDHHISEMTVTQGNGSRYVYGLPVYNNFQKEVSFSVNESQVSPNVTDQDNFDYGLVGYSGTDNTINNRNGVDRFFDATHTPAYAHAFLISGILSPDYVDRTGDGITDDDLGNAVKFNYSKVNADYKWRVPVQANKARYHEGNKSTKDDDKASYVYGSKELWYAHSIESRTMLAQFYTSARKDALGVLGENGGKDINAEQMQLDSILLFSKAELLAKGPQAAVPIKSVHFNYEYLLCKILPNHKDQEKGKLTLTNVYFKYGKSQRGKLNAYQFNYQDKDINGLPYNYNIGLYDRWGFYKKNPQEYPPTHEYPYVLQEGSSSVTQKNAGAWNLNKITLPSGGAITIEYEADDYAYVQNKRAGQMMKVEGFSDVNKVDSISTTLYDSPDDLKKYLALKLVDSVQSISEAKKRYLEGIEQIYFDCLVDLKKGNEERVKGYLQVDPDLPPLLDSGRTTLFIPMKYLKDKKDRDIPPITFAALQKMRLELPELFYPGFKTKSGPEAILKSMVGLVNEIANLTRGLSFHSMKKKWGKNVITNNRASWVRLCNPDFKKIGGGTRVKKLKMNDEWAIPSGGGESEYGQEYNYVKSKTIEGAEMEISSGVASFEPGIGGEENLMREALPYAEKHRLAPKAEFYSETPIGESLFPAPSVGYSKVKVTDIANSTIGLFRNRSGHTIHEFYTAQDFPTIVRSTKAKPDRVRSNPLANFFKFSGRDAMALSQGYAIELNDMHGKARSQHIYDRDGAELSSTNYFYRTTANSKGQKQLANQVPVLQPDGMTGMGNLGLETDIWQEMLEEVNTTTNAGAATNSDVFAFPFPPIPIPIISFFPKFNNQSTSFRAAVTTKLIKRSGILDKVVVTENGASVATENVLHDSETGEVLLTKTTNEFDDPMYAFTYPAHWAYERMGQAYQNVGAVFKDLTIEGGIITTPGFNEADFFHPGDELRVFTETTSESKKYYVTKPGIGLLDHLFILDEEGLPIDGIGVNLKIVRSGIRNQASTPIGQVTSRENPVVANSLDFSDNTKVLDATAVTFSDEWKMLCDTKIDQNSRERFIDTIFNPYTSGMFGSWRPNASYVYYDQRTPSMLASNGVGMHIRDKGQANSFSSFWGGTRGSGNWSMVSSLKWTLSNRITLYDWKGNELENEDALGISSAAYFGYERSLPIAVANNSNYREILFDSFEDYRYENDCNNDFDFQRSAVLFDIENPFNGVELQENIAHTGRFSLKINDGNRIVATINVDNSCTPKDVILDREILNDRINVTDEIVTQGIGSDKLKKRKSPTPVDICYSNPNDSPAPFESECCACLPLLTLDRDSSYYFSAWVASDSSLLCGNPPNLATFNFFLNDGFPENFGPTGPVIDGWQRVEGKLIASPVNLNTILLTVVNFNSVPIYLDDLRIHPWRSNMQSYVYDPYSLRLMATLDQNNYASFYEYDDEGLLIRTKRETEKGIVTLQEGRTVLKTNN